MSANTNPIFSLTPKVSWANTGTTGDTNKTGTGSGTQLVWTAGSNGGRINRIDVQAVGNVATAGVVRFFINNGSTPSVGANNSLIHEETFPQITSLSDTAANSSVTWLCGLVLPAGYKLYACFTQNSAAGLQITAEGGDF